jgi:hypothetical protein
LGITRGTTANRTLAIGPPPTTATASTAPPSMPSITSDDSFPRVPIE